MKKDEISVECEDNPLMEKILQNAIKKKRGQRSFLPHRLPDDVFNELAAFSYKYLEQELEYEKEEDQEKLCHEAIFLCVTQIFDYQQNPYKHGEVTLHEDEIYEAIGTYCMCLQFELITRTKSLGITISPSGLHNIFDGERALKIEVESPVPSNIPESVKNVSLKTLVGIKDILKKKKALDSLNDDTTIH